MSEQKSRPSKLDRYAETLLGMDAERKTLAEMVTWLRGEGCTVSLGRLSEFLSSQRQAQAQQQMLAQIASGAQAVKEIEQQFADNPAPELETLIKLYRVLILKLSTAGNADPALIELATAMTKQAMEYEKMGIKKQELELNREKFQRETCELFIKWNADKTAKDIAASDISHSDKIEKLGQAMFGDDWK